MSALTKLYRALRVRSMGPHGLYDVALAAAAAATRVLGADTTLKSSDGATLTAIAVTIDLSAGDALVAGVYKRFAALNDQSIVGTGAWTKSFRLNGAAAVLPSANGKDISVAIVAVLVTDVPALYAIFGAEAATGASVGPTAAEIHRALEAAAVADMDTTAILVVARLTLVMAAGDITLTHLDPATDDGLKAERSMGSISAGASGS